MLPANTSMSLLAMTALFNKALNDETVMKQMLDYFKHEKNKSDPGSPCQSGKMTSQHGCDQLGRMLTLYGFTPLLLICLFGNTMAIVVYQALATKSSAAVKTLTTRCVLNMAYMFCFVPTQLRELRVWESFSESVWESTYWHSMAYVTTAANVVGACSTWVTWLMTLERYLSVFYPMQSRVWCSNRNFYKSLVLTVFLTLILSVVYPIAREVAVVHCADKRIQYFLTNRPEAAYKTYEKTNHWLCAVFFIIVPLVSMLYMAIMIAVRLLCQGRMTRHGSEQKRCMTVLTLVTAVAHLVVELPAVPVFLAAAIDGPHIISSEPVLCYWHAVATFLTYCNASLLFFIYFLFSTKFREIFRYRIRCQPVPDPTNVAVSRLNTGLRMLSRSPPDTPPVRNGATPLLE